MKDIHRSTLARSLRTYGKVPDALFDHLDVYLQVEYYEAGTMMPMCDFEKDRIYFLEKGLARKFYFDRKLNEIVVWFGEQGDILLYSGTIFEYHEDREEFLEVLEDTCIISLTCDEIKTAGILFPRVIDIAERMSLENQSRELRRLWFLHLATVEQQCKYLYRYYPYMAVRLDDTQIAYYLGIEKEVWLEAKGAYLVAPDEEEED